MSDVDGTDYCHHCRRVTGNRVERGMGRTAFVCVECGLETDACFDDEPELCPDCGCEDCECDED